MAGTKVFTSFGLKDVAVATRLTTAGTPNWLDIPSVEQAGFKLNVSEVEQWGDDKYQGTFYHSQKGVITVKANKQAIAVFEKLSGNTASSPSSKETMYFGTDLELTPPRLSVRAKTTVRMEDGSASEMTIYWFNCDVKTVWDSIPGAERAKIGEIQLQFNTYPSTTDETGAAINPAYGWAFGRFEV